MLGDEFSWWLSLPLKCLNKHLWKKNVIASFQPVGLNVKILINREFDFLCFFQDINTRLKNIINGAPCVLFMKGSPQEPLCGLCHHLYFCANLMCILLMFPCDGVSHLFHIVGFSRQMVDLLNSHGAKFSHFDILSDNEVRQGMYVFSLIPCTVFTHI